MLAVRHTLNCACIPDCSLSGVVCWSDSNVVLKSWAGICVFPHMTDSRTASWMNTYCSCKQNKQKTWSAGCVISGTSRHVSVGLRFDSWCSNKTTSLALFWLQIITVKDQQKLLYSHTHTHPFNTAPSKEDNMKTLRQVHVQLLVSYRCSAH